MPSQKRVWFLLSDLLVVLRKTDKPIRTQVCNLSCECRTGPGVGLLYINHMIITYYYAIYVHVMCMSWKHVPKHLSGKHM